MGRTGEVLRQVSRPQRFAFSRQRLSDGANGNRAGDHHHAHLGENPVVTGHAPRRITRDRGGSPKPLLQELIGQILQSRLDAPIIFAGDEPEPVGVADLAGQLFKRLGRVVLPVFRIHNRRCRCSLCSASVISARGLITRD